MYSVYASDITKAKGKQDVNLNIFNANFEHDKRFFYSFIDASKAQRLLANLLGHLWPVVL